MLTVSNIPSERACNEKAAQLQRAGYRILKAAPCFEGAFAIIASNKPDPLPPLGEHVGGWVAIDREGKAVREFMRADRHLAERVDLGRFALVAIDEYLAALAGRLGHTVGTLAWQLLHMDWPEDRPATLHDAKAVLDMVEAE